MKLSQILRAVGIVLLIISIISATQFTEDRMLGAGFYKILFISVPLFLFSLFIFLLSITSKKTPLEEDRSKQRYPILTKIIAWGLILFSLYSFLLNTLNSKYFGRCIRNGASPRYVCYIETFLISFFLSIPYFILAYSGILILKKRKRAWWITIIILIYLFIANSF